MENLKIYFCGSIRGGRNDAELYNKIIAELKNYGTVLTEHVGELSLTDKGGDGTSDEIYIRDTNWLKECDIVIAECSTPSLGVGYEIAYAEAINKPIYVFYGKDDGRLSAMIAGDPAIKIYEYKGETELFDMLKQLKENL